MVLLKIEVLSTYTTKSGATAYKVNVNGHPHTASARGDSKNSFIITYNKELRDLTAKTNLTLSGDKFVVGATFEHSVDPTANRSVGATLTRASGATFADLTDDGNAIKYGGRLNRALFTLGVINDPALVSAFKLVNAFRDDLKNALGEIATLEAVSGALDDVVKLEAVKHILGDDAYDVAVANAYAKMPKAVNDFIKKYNK